MPRKPIKSFGYTCTPEHCRDKRHMTQSQFFVYDTMKGAAVHARKQRGGKGPLLFTAPVVPTLCNWLAYSSRNAVDKVIAQLADAGWLIFRGRDRKPDGTETPNAWEIVEHDEFIAAHPDSCPDNAFANFAAAGTHGVKIGHKATSGETPANFGGRLPDAAMADDMSVLSDDDWEQVSRYMKKSSHSRKRVTGATTHASAVVGEDTTTHVSGGQPLTRLRPDHSRADDLTTHVSALGYSVLPSGKPTPPPQPLQKGGGGGGTDTPKTSTTNETEATDTIVAKELKAIRDFWSEKEPNELPELPGDELAAMNKIREYPGQVLPAFKVFYKNDGHAGLTRSVLGQFVKTFDKWNQAAQRVVKNSTEISAEQIAAITKQYTERHMKLWGQPAEVVDTTALTDLFPEADTDKEKGNE